MSIREFTSEDGQAVERLVLASFREFVSQDCTEEGIQNFKAFASVSSLITMSKAGEILVAVEGDAIVGVVGRVKDRIRYLFVDKEWQGRGIASALLRQSEEQARRESYVKLYVRSSLYAQEFYKKQGYKRTTRIIQSHGVAFRPMSKSL